MEIYQEYDTSNKSGSGDSRKNSNTISTTKEYWQKLSQSDNNTTIPYGTPFLPGVTSFPTVNLSFEQFAILRNACRENPKLKEVITDKFLNLVTITVEV